MAKTYLDYTQAVYNQLKGRPDKSVKARDYMRDTLGWTEAEIDSLKMAPRTGAVTSRSTWVKINGVNTYPFSWLLTQEEYDTYDGFAKAYSGSEHATRTRTTTSGPVFSEEQKEVIESIRLLVDTLPAELQEKFATAFPTEKEIKMRAIQAQMDALKAQMEELSK